MGYPAEGTVEIPAHDPELATMVAGITIDPDAVRDELVAGLSGGDARAGHLCVNAWVFDPDYAHVVLVRHPRFGWTNPGGHVAPGEAPAEAALREVVEEIGMTPTPAAAGPVAVVATEIPAKGDHPAHMHYTLTYAFIAPTLAPLVGEADQPACWFALDEELPEGFFGDNHTCRPIAVDLAS